MSIPPANAADLWSEACDQLALSPPSGACDQLQQFLDHTLEVGRIHNLTGIKDPMEAWNVLVLQSLVFLPALAGERATDRETRVIDIGSGAGIPAIPLAVVGCGEQRLEVTAVECRKKKADSIATAARTLGLERFTVSSQRAEDLGQHVETRERFDAAVMRAVGPLAEVLEYGLPLVRVGGLVLVAKSLGQLDREVPAGRQAARLLGGGDPAVELITLLDRKTALLAVRKERKTPSAYPRRPGAARQAPLRGR